MQGGGLPRNSAARRLQDRQSGSGPAHSISAGWEFTDQRFPQLDPQGGSELIDQPDLQSVRRRRAAGGEALDNYAKHSPASEVERYRRVFGTAGMTNARWLRETVGCRVNSGCERSRATL